MFIRLFIVFLAVIFFCSCGSINSLVNRGAHISKGLISTPKNILKNRKNKKVKNVKKNNHYVSDKYSSVSNTSPEYGIYDPNKEEVKNPLHSKEKALDIEEALSNFDSDLPSIDEDFSIKDLKSIKSSDFSWKSNPSLISRLSSQQNRLMLVYFLHSGIAGTHNSLDSEVFSSKDFINLVEKNNILLLRLDYGDESLSRDQSSDQLKRLKKHLRIKGYPTVILRTPYGVEAYRQNGYTPGTNMKYLEMLTSGIKYANKLRDEYLDSLVKKGYKFWEDKSGVKIIAKFLKVKDRKVYLLMPNGKRRYVRLNKLSKSSLQEVMTKKNPSSNKNIFKIKNSSL